MTIATTEVIDTPTVTVDPEKPILSRVFLQQFQGTKYLTGRQSRSITLSNVDPDEVWKTVEEALLGRYAKHRTRTKRKKARVDFNNGFGLWLSTHA